MSILNKTIHDYNDYFFTSTLVEENGVSKLFEGCLPEFEKARDVIKVLINQKVFDGTKTVDEIIISYIKHYYANAIKREDIIREYDMGCDIKSKLRLYNRKYPNNDLKNYHDEEMEIDYLNYNNGIVLNDCIFVTKNNTLCTHISRIKYEPSFSAKLIFYYQVDLKQFGVDYIKLRIPIYTIHGVDSDEIKLPYLVTNDMYVSFTMTHTYSSHMNINVCVYGINHKPSDATVKKCKIDAIKTISHDHKDIGNNLSVRYLATTDSLNSTCNKNVMNLYYHQLYKNTGTLDRSNDCYDLENVVLIKNSIEVELKINKSSNDYHFSAYIPMYQIDSLKFDCLNTRDEINLINLYKVISYENHTIGKVLLSKKYPDETGLVTYSTPFFENRGFLVTVKYTDQFIEFYNKLILYGAKTNTKLYLTVNTMMP